MYPASFAYAAPTTLDEAVAMLAERPDSRVIAGGQSLLPMMKLRLLAPQLVVDLGRIPGLVGIREGEGILEVGAMTTHATAAASPVLRAKASALAEAASVVGDPLVRNRGTVGGSAAHADPVGDEPGALVALDVRFVVRGPEGERTVAAEEFFLDAFTTALEPGEVLTAMRLSVAGANEGSAYRKLGRRGRSRDYPVAGAAAWVRLHGDTIAGCRVAITGAPVRTSRATALEGRLLGGPAGAIPEAAPAAAEGMTVLGDLYGSRAYKEHLAGVLARRALEAAVASARSGSAPGR